MEKVRLWCGQPSESDRGRLKPTSLCSHFPCNSFY